MITDRNVLNAIAALLDRREWSPDTLEEIAALVRVTGRLVRDSEDTRT